jgi:acyl carrier protein phosphodiesterase
MNWLAHLHLSGPSAGTRIGNILPGLVRSQELQGIALDFVEGIELHHKIDAFTDRQPIFRRSVGRVEGPL